MPRGDRVQEIRALDALHGRAHLVDTGEVADSDVHASRPQHICAFIVIADIGADALAHLQQCVDCCATGATSRTANQKLGSAHDLRPF